MARLRDVAYRVAVIRPSTLAAIPSIALAACVNNYVVGDEGGTSAGTIDGGTVSAQTTSGAIPSDEGDTSSVCMDPVCPEPTSSTGAAGDPEDDGNSGPGDTGLPPTGRAPCDPCENDLQCGGEFDACVDLGGASAVCTVRCVESPPCDGDAACEQVVSVEGTMSEQCVPSAGCPEADPKGGSGSM